REGPSAPDPSLEDPCGAVCGHGGPHGGDPLGGCCSRHLGQARLVVTVTSGRGRWRGDHVTATDAYVQVTFGSRRGRTGTVWNNQSPRWDARVDLGTVELSPGGPKLRLEVWDEDNQWDDDFLGACEEEVEAGANHEVVCYVAGGRLDFSYWATCGPALGGPRCQDYVPQPPQGDLGVYRSSHWPPR
ncbi:PERF protein, partial [Aegotheles bennettii]|nr:PERF protein [Aegotheles bennettii]NWX13657.1 PERF protein [Aegotheles bennettii]